MQYQRNQHQATKTSQVSPHTELHFTYYHDSIAIYLDQICPYYGKDTFLTFTASNLQHSKTAKVQIPNEGIL